MITFTVKIETLLGAATLEEYLNKEKLSFTYDVDAMTSNGEGATRRKRKPSKKRRTRQGNLTEKGYREIMRLAKDHPNLSAGDLAKKVPHSTTVIGRVLNGTHPLSL